MGMGATNDDGHDDYILIRAISKGQDNDDVDSGYHTTTHRNL